MNTLRGVFSTPKPPKRNFIQENVRQLREMTNYWQSKEGDEEQSLGLQFPQKYNKYMNVPARVPLHVTGTGAKTVTAKKSPELQNMKSKTRNIKSQPKGLAISKSSPGNKTTKFVKQPRKIRAGARTKTATDEIRLREGDVADYVRKQRESVLGKQNENQYSDSDLSLEESESGSIEYIKPPVSLPFNRQSTVAHKSTACQTVEADRLDSIYEEGIIRYPSAGKNGPKQFSPNKTISFRNMSQQTERSQPPVIGLKPPQGVATRGKQSATLTHVKSERSNPISTELNLELGDPHRSADYVRMNAKAASAVPSRTPAQSRSDRMKPPPTYQRGIVPRYLQKRQTQWQKDEVQRQHDAPDPTCPPGHVPLPDSERKDSLKMLRKSYADLVHELNTLPVRADTLRIRQRKMDIEKQLNKLEEGIKVFSRPKVFVKIGD